VQAWDFQHKRHKGDNSGEAVVLNHLLIFCCFLTHSCDGLMHVDTRVDESTASRTDRQTERPGAEAERKAGGPAKSQRKVEGSKDDSGMVLRLAPCVLFVR
jgi:hypothetical protein